MMTTDYVRYAKGDGPSLGQVLRCYVAEDGKFEDRDGSIWVRDGSGDSARHAFEAWWYSWKQYFCTNPGYNARWDGVTGHTLVVVRAE